MATRRSGFSNAVFSVSVPSLAPHANPVSNVIMGIAGPITAVSPRERITGDMLFIRPGVEHSVQCGPAGFTVLYLDGLRHPGAGSFARRLGGVEAQVALAAMSEVQDAADDLRTRLAEQEYDLPPELRHAIDDLVSEPMVRMSQFELAERLQLERTRALRAFKAATGQTFRQFKQWTALQHAARNIAAGELVRTAALDAGFADTAHLSRTFRASFGLSPAQALAGQGKAAAH